MALVDFYQQSNLLSPQPRDLKPLHSFLEGSNPLVMPDGHPNYELEDHSVFINIEGFMRTILRVPADWKTQWGPAIHTVKHNPDFLKHCLDYGICRKKERAEPHESYHASLLLMNEAAIRVAFPATRNQDAAPTPPPLSQLVRIVDDWSDDCMLEDGRFIPHVAFKEKRPPPNPDIPPLGPTQPASGGASRTSTLENSRKRKRDQEPIPDRKKRRLGITPDLGSVDLRVDTEGASSDMDTEGFFSPMDVGGPFPPMDTEGSFSQMDTEVSPSHMDAEGSSSDTDSEASSSDTEVVYPPGPQYRLKQRTDLGRLLMLFLSFRPHVTIGLVDRNRIQFYHADHSVVLISSPISLSLQDKEGGIDRFIAILIAFHRLSMLDQTIFGAGQNGTVLRLRRDDKVKEPIEVDLGKAVSLFPSLVGRSTAVMYGTSPEWPNSQLVVKISWVEDSRVSEQELMEKAVQEAARPGHEWALNHLPRFCYVEDVSDQTDASVRDLFKKSRIKNYEYTYQRRLMRIVVQEPLHPLTMLASTRDVGQVMLDVASVHRWLYDQVGILHGDINLANIMYRVIEGEIRGVLTDYDFSSWKAAPATDHAKTSRRATGTPVYMARELLSKTSTTRLYRHDVESLFYVLLVLCGHYTIGHTRGQSGSEEKLQLIERDGRLPYHYWMAKEDYWLEYFKGCFIEDGMRIELSPTFEVFRMWLEDLRSRFANGFKKRYEKRMEEQNRKRSLDKSEDLPWSHVGEPIQYDDETFGGYIDYSTFIEGARRMTGELEGLVVRYDPSPR